LALIRSFLIDSGRPQARARQLVQKNFAVRFCRARSTTMKNLSRRRANFVRTRRSQRNAGTARSPYFIERFATSACCVRAVIARARYAMLQQADASPPLHDMHRARRIYTSLSRVSVFFIAL
jgi:hypothetical protein